MSTLKQDRGYEKERRAQIYNILGRKCVQCGFLDERALQVDHINGGGSKERKLYKGNGAYGLVRAIKEQPLAFQILCANCNWIKRAVNGENRTTNKL